MLNRSIKCVIEDILYVWDNNNEEAGRRVMLQNAKVTNYLIMVVFVAYIGLAATYMTIPIMTYNAVPIDGRRFIFPSTFPSFVNAKQSPIYEILCIYHFVVASFCTNGNVLVDGLLLTSVKIYQFVG